MAFGVEDNQINYDKLYEALKKAEIYKFIFQLKKNINTQVGENGSNFSQVQIQRIALARALYFEPDILIPDEPTSSLDQRNEESIIESVENTIIEFGGIDICINNASAISLTGTLQTEMKRYDLMHNINGRGTFLTSKLCIPHLLKSSNPHILNISPPLDMDPKWFKSTVAYTIAKFNMSMCVLGMAAEFEGKVAVNALWPRTAIKTAAVANVLGGDEIFNKSRSPEIMADAAYIILNKDKDKFTGNFVIDDSILAEHGETDFTKYADYPFQELIPDFFVPEHAYPVPKIVKDN